MPWTAPDSSSVARRSSSARKTSSASVSACSRLSSSRAATSARLSSSQSLANNVFHDWLHADSLARLCLIFAPRLAFTLWTTPKDSSTMTRGHSDLIVIDAFAVIAVVNNEIYVPVLIRLLMGCQVGRSTKQGGSPHQAARWERIRDCPRSFPGISLGRSWRGLGAFC